MTILLIFVVIVLGLNPRWKLYEKPPADSNTKNVKIAKPLKYLYNFRRALEIVSINVKLILF